MVEKFFGINYEFDFDAAIASIDEKLRVGETGYICVSDGVILNTYHRNEGYRNVVDNAMFSICDSSYVPIYIRRIYGLERKQCSGTKFMELIVSQRKYTMAFVGGDKTILESLKENLMKMNPDVENMLFYELPFCKVADFDYEGIAAEINEAAPDIVFVSLGAPKQEFFMSFLDPHLKRGVSIAVGAAFKFHSGKGEKRAPKWMLKCHLEFLHRIFEEPKKQIPRCFWILRTTPGILWREWRKVRKERRQTKNKEE